MKLDIVPVGHVSSHKTGSIAGLTKEEIVRRLGFEPNVADDADKVEHSWAFTVQGKECAVWDWKGSHRLRSWSAYGPTEVMREVFGNHYSQGAW